MHPGGLIKVICIIEALYCCAAWLNSTQTNPAYLVCYTGLHHLVMTFTNNFLFVFIVFIQVVFIFIVLYKGPSPLPFGELWEIGAKLK